jgi:hypothetical protein
MNRQYDVFEIYPDHSVKWHACVVGLARAIEKLEALGRETLNECFATDLGTQQIVARVNADPSVEKILDDSSASAN